MYFVCQCPPFIEGWYKSLPNFNWHVSLYDTGFNIWLYCSHAQSIGGARILFLYWFWITRGNQYRSCNDEDTEHKCHPHQCPEQDTGVHATVTSVFLLQALQDHANQDSHLDLEKDGVLEGKPCCSHFGYWPSCPLWIYFFYYLCCRYQAQKMNYYIVATNKVECKQERINHFLDGSVVMCATF